MSIFHIKSFIFSSNSRFWLNFAIFQVFFVVFLISRFSRFFIGSINPEKYTKKLERSRNNHALRYAHRCIPQVTSLLRDWTFTWYKATRVVIQWKRKFHLHIFATNYGLIYNFSVYTTHVIHIVPARSSWYISGSMTS